MKANQLVQRAVLFGTLVGLTGCAGAGPVATAPEQQAQPDRQVLALGEPVTELEQAKQLISQLPQRISEQDAKTMLVQIDPSQIQQKEPSTYEVQRWRGRGYGGYGWRGYGWRGLGGYGLGAFSYLPYGGYYFPYTYASGYYTPYTYSLTTPYAATAYPYLYPYSGVYRPYRWWW